jgi:hypothetical protein
MSFQIDMLRGSYGDPNFEEFNLDIWTWRRLIQIAKANGWDSKGTKPHPESQASVPDYMKHFQPDYEPREWALMKVFDGADALELAKALMVGFARLQTGEITLSEDGRLVLLVEGMNKSEFEWVNGSIKKVIPSFVDFLQRGDFDFAWDD